MDPHSLHSWKGFTVGKVSKTFQQTTKGFKADEFCCDLCFKVRICLLKISVHDLSC